MGKEPGKNRHEVIKCLESSKICKLVPPVIVNLIFAFRVEAISTGLVQVLMFEFSSVSLILLYFSDSDVNI